MLINPLAARVSPYVAPRAAVSPAFVPQAQLETFTAAPMPMFAIAGLMRAAIAPVTVALAGTPLQLTLDDLRWPRPAQREVEAHMQDRGLRKSEPLAGLVRSELAEARKADFRVRTPDMLKAINLSEKAQRLQPVVQDALFGFTRLTDAKFALTPTVLDKLEAMGAPEPLVSNLDKVLGGDGASDQLNLDMQTANWLTGALNTLKIPTRYAMGGAGTFCANLAACQPNVRAAFWALSGVPPTVAAGMHPAVTVYDQQGGRRTPADSVDASLYDRINYIAEYRGAASGRLILSTPSDQEIGFGNASRETLEKAIEGKKLFFFAGAHYTTKGDPAAADALAQGLAVMKSANPDCMFHLQYVKPKDAANEKAVMAKVAPSVDSMSLNTVELPALLERIQDGYDGISSQSKREVMEEPRHVMDNIYRLRDSMGLQRAHVHGMWGDMVLTRTPRDKERTILALLKARQLAAMKAANESGQILKKGEMWPVLPLVEGRCLAAVQKFADSVKERFQLSDIERAQVARDWFYDDGKGNTLFFVPSRGIHDRTGGTVSLGDTIDATALLYSFE